MWVADHDANKLFQLDAESAKATGSVEVPSAADVDAGFGSLWVASEEQKVYEIDPSTLEVLNVIKVDAAHAIAVAYGSVWVSSGGEADVVTRIDPKTGERLAEIETTVAGFPDRMAAAGGLLWVGQYQAPTLLGIDPKTNEVSKELPAGSGAAVVWSAFGDLWVANYDDATVWRLDTG
jgi:streptogramin lyase